MRVEKLNKLTAAHWCAAVKAILPIAAFLAFIVFLPVSAVAQVVIAQISDTHLGEVHSPHAFDNLRRTVDMVNARHPDAVIVSGDVGENYDEWLRARGILKWLHAPVYYAPGNHDVHSNDVEKYRAVFGPDYYRFQVKGVTFLVIDSQLLGNFDQFDAQSPPPMPSETQAESDRMLSWLDHQAKGHDDDHRHDSKHGGQGDNNDRNSRIIIGVQHIPVFRDEKALPDPKPYWTINEPYRSREMELLHKLGIRHMLVGHWHVGDVFERDGIVWHVAPTTSRPLPWSNGMGFAMHTITPDGDVKTEFVPLGTAP
jgi:3',5'-cyclic AMP phosphodiesterase CpdA